MAKNYTYGSKTNVRFAIKGTLSPDGDMIDYTNSNGDAATIDVAKCFAPFKGMFVELSIVTKAEEDLSEGFEED